MNDPLFDPMFFERIRVGKALWEISRVFVSITNNMILWLKVFREKGVMANKI
jgi:hypothetical protein